MELADPEDADAIASWQLESGHLDHEAGMYFIGPEAERRYGQIHYRDLMAVFTAAPEFLVFHGRTEIGSLDPMTLTTKVEGPRIIALAGRAWVVNHTDFKRRRVHVEPTKVRGDSTWNSFPPPQSFELADAIRRLLCGTDPPVALTRRAQDALSNLRAEYSGRVDPEANVIALSGKRAHMWTWAGARANAVLVAAIDAVDPELLGESITFDNASFGLRGDASPGWVRQVFTEAHNQYGPSLEGIVPHVDERALRGLKFNEMLPPDLARHTLAARYADHEGAERILRRRVSSSII